MLREIGGYSGWGIHHGPWAVARGLHLVSLGFITWANPPAWAPWMSASKLAFLALYGIAALWARRLGPLDGILVTFFLFYLVYSGVASQYLVWAVPFLLLADRPAMFWSYELAGTYALVVFYWLFFPDILYGSARAPGVETASLLAQYVVSQLAFSATCAAGLIVFGGAALRRRYRRSPPATPPMPTPATSVTSPASTVPARIGVVGWLACAYYAVVLVWELVFILSIGRA
jgi:hypothetical protein